jgi:hypothetical protein
VPLHTAADRKELVPDNRNEMKLRRYVELCVCFAVHRMAPKLPSTGMLFNVMRKENLRILYLQDVLGIVLIFEAEYIVTSRGTRDANNGF